MLDAVCSMQHAACGMRQGGEVRERVRVRVRVRLRTGVALQKFHGRSQGQGRGRVASWLTARPAFQASFVRGVRSVAEGLKRRHPFANPLLKRDQPSRDDVLPSSAPSLRATPFASGPAAAGTALDT